MRAVLGVHWKDWCWSWNSTTLATWCEELTYLKRPWCWERLKVGGEGDDRGWDGWMASLTRWTWVWVNSGSWWWTGRPSVLQPMGSQNQTWLSDWTELIFLKAFPALVTFHCRLWSYLQNLNETMLYFRYKVFKTNTLPRPIENTGILWKSPFQPLFSVVTQIPLNSVTLDLLLVPRNLALLSLCPGILFFTSIFAANETISLRPPQMSNPGVKSQYCQLWLALDTSIEVY